MRYINLRLTYLLLLTARQKHNVLNVSARSLWSEPVKIFWKRMNRFWRKWPTGGNSMKWTFGSRGQRSYEAGDRLGGLAEASSSTPNSNSFSSCVRVLNGHNDVNVEQFRTMSPHKHDDELQTSYCYQRPKTTPCTGQTNTCVCLWHHE